MNEQIRLLFVDDEPNVLNALQRTFMEDDYEILTVSSAKEGWALMEHHQPIHVVISDYQMPEENGVDFLTKVSNRWPESVRIILSGHADIWAIVAAINDGHIYGFVAKPWFDDEIQIMVANALEFYALNQQIRTLASKLAAKNEALVRANNILERLVAGNISRLKFENRHLSVAHAMLDLLPVAVLGINRQGVIAHCNGRGRELFGVTTGNVYMGTEYAMVLQPELKAFIETVVKAETATDTVMLNGTKVLLQGKAISEQRFSGILIWHGEENTVPSFPR